MTNVKKWRNVVDKKEMTEIMWKICREAIFNEKLYEINIRNENNEENIYQYKHQYMVGSCYI